MSVLRSYGIPNLLPVVVAPSEAPLKVRSACKKLVNAATAASGLHPDPENWTPKLAEYQIELITLQTIAALTSLFTAVSWYPVYLQ